MVELAVDDDAGEEEECRLSVLLKVYVDNIMRPNRVFVVVVVVFSVADDVPKALLCRQMNECTRSLATAHIQPASQPANQQPRAQQQKTESNNQLAFTAAAAASLPPTKARILCIFGSHKRIKIE